mgnify:FL=1
MIQLGFVALLMQWFPSSPWPRRLGGLLIGKVMLESGLHKLVDVGQDPGWLNGAAMSSFFEVAAIPGPLAPLADALPHPVMMLAGWAVLLTEIVGPFLLLSTPRLKRVVLLSWMGLMVGIIATANFGVLPYAMLAACLLLVEDTWVERLWSRLAGPLRLERLKVPETSARVLGWVQGASLALILCSSAQVGLDLFSQPGPSSPTVWLHSWRISTPYSMFRRIPPERMEMQLEVQVEGQWGDVYLAHKVGPTDAHPGIVAPHHPRLPFLLWFQATLGRGLPDLRPDGASLTQRGDEQLVRGSSGASRRVAQRLTRSPLQPLR